MKKVSYYIPMNEEFVYFLQESYEEGHPVIEWEIVRKGNKEAILITAPEEAIQTLLKDFFNY